MLGSTVGVSLDSFVGILVGVALGDAVGISVRSSRIGADEGNWVLMGSIVTGIVVGIDVIVVVGGKVCNGNKVGDGVGKTVKVTDGDDEVADGDEVGIKVDSGGSTCMGAGVTTDSSVVGGAIVGCTVDGAGV